MPIIATVCETLRADVVASDFGHLIVVNSTQRFLNADEPALARCSAATYTTILPYAIRDLQERRQAQWSSTPAELRIVLAKVYACP